MNLISFDYNNNVVRTQVTDDGEPLFCLTDVCKVLEISDPSNTTRQLKEEFGRPVLNTGLIVDANNHAQQATFITEPQLYFVMMRSRSENAKPFRQWVVNEVLPSIRKTGSYQAPHVEKSRAIDRETLDLYSLVLEKAGIQGNQLALALDKAVKAETGKSALALTGVQLKAPQQEHLATPTELGKQIGLSGQKINKILEEAGLQCKDINDKWAPTEEGLALGAVLLDVGKAHSNGTPIRQLKWSMSVLGSIKQLLKEEE